MIALFNTVLYEPIYNLLILFVGLAPWGDIGIAVIAVTLVVKVLTFPISLSVIKTQQAMKVIGPKLTDLKAKHKDNPQELTKEMMALYRHYKVNPFSSFILILIQIPILLALYFVFIHESLPQVDAAILYSFIPVPDAVQTMFLGIFAMAGKSIILALLAGATQAVQAWYSIPVPEGKPGASLAEDFGRAMTLQARYVIPVIIAFAAYATSGAVALYFITSNLFAIGQEVVVRRSGLRTDLSKA